MGTSAQINSDIIIIKSQYNSNAYCLVFLYLPEEMML